ncbi:MAG: helix-turn-helix domain-containing protein [Janthinobacterium lividum]
MRQLVPGAGWVADRQGLTPEKLQLALTAKDLHDTGKYSINEVAKRLKLPIATCYRYLTFVRNKQNEQEIEE